MRHIIIVNHLPNNIANFGPVPGLVAWSKERHVTHRVYRLHEFASNVHDDLVELEERSVFLLLLETNRNETKAMSSAL